MLVRIVNIRPAIETTRLLADHFPNVQLEILEILRILNTVFRAICQPKQQKIGIIII